MESLGRKALDMFSGNPCGKPCVWHRVRLTVVLQIGFGSIKKILLDCYMADSYY